MNFIQEHLNTHTYRWLITGVAGFIGSHLLENLLKLNQIVVGIDNFSTGSSSNLNEVKLLVTKKQWDQFIFVEGDISHFPDCQKIMKNIDYVLHHAAFVSVPASIQYPEKTHQVNVNGFANLLLAARKAKIKRFVYASSSAVYGDDNTLPKVEKTIGRALSPYALSKNVNELYADIFSHIYQMEIVGLRYFNIFGSRQNIHSDYSAVIPRWINQILHQERIEIYGDGENTRDFCYVEDAVQANLLAALTDRNKISTSVYNIALQQATTLNQLFLLIKETLKRAGYSADCEPRHTVARIGDIRFSEADITLAQKDLDYQPQYSVKKGLELLVKEFIKNYSDVCV